MSDTAVDTSSEITTKDLKEKKKVVEEAENGRHIPANRNAQNEENGGQEADNEVDEEEEEGGEEEEEEEEKDDDDKEDGDEDEEAEAPTGRRVAEDDDVDTKKQRLMRMTRQKEEKLTLHTVTIHPPLPRLEKQAPPTGAVPPTDDMCSPPPHQNHNMNWQHGGKKEPELPRPCFFS